MANICWELEEASEDDQLLCPHYKLGKLMITKLASQEGLDRFKHLLVKDSDIFLCSYPRSGTHWLAYIISLIVHNGQLPEGQSQGLLDAAKFITGFIWSDDDFNSMADPRIFYDHLPYKYFKSIGKPNSKYVYVARNPKEVAISTYNFLTTKKHGGLLFGFNESWDQFFESFIKGETYYGSWLEHVSEWWRHRNDENVLFIWYEELLNDLPGSIKRIAEFLEQPVSEKLKQEICEKASFEAMKSDKDVKVADFLLLPPSAFFRAGTNKSWKDVFTKEQNSKMDKLLMAAKHVLNWNIDFS